MDEWPRELCYSRIRRRTSRLFGFLTVLLLVLVPAPPAWALTYMPISDAALADEADVIASGTIVESAVLPARCFNTCYSLRIDRLLKGNPGAPTLLVRVPGAMDPNSEASVRIPGAPRFASDERVLLFLNPRSDGDYVITELALGAFYISTAKDGTSLLLRDLAQARDASGQDADVEPALHREQKRFEQWLAGRAAGGASSADYWTAKPLASPESWKFALLGDPPVRWFDFDENRSVSFFAGVAGQQGVPGGGYTEFIAALTAWTLDLASNINYIFGGISAASGGLSDADGVNAVLFNDPNDELDGAYDCQRGGILAATRFRTNGTRTFDGRVFQRIVEADTVVRKGAGCFVSGNHNANMAELLAHELGHSLGLAHSCGDTKADTCIPGTVENDALMRPLMHADGRGATLAADDRHGISYLYPWHPVGGMPSNVPPSGDPAGDPADGGGGGSDPGNGGGGGGALDLQTLAAFVLMLAAGSRRRRRGRD